MGTFIDLTGKRFGKLTVIERADNRGKHVYWKCKCDCGNIHEARADGLRKGTAVSCGKCDFDDLVGKRFGRRVVIERDADRYSADGYPIRYWICKCDCGTVSSVPETRLINNKANSCGCATKDMMRKKQTKHKGSNTRLYNIWLGMRARTKNNNSPAWKDYGGRGITICDEWIDSFEVFRDWAYSNGYKENLSIDRIDVNGNYSPENCRWITMDEQARNKRNTVRITYMNKCFNAHDWSILTGIPEKIIKERYHDGWDSERILFQPVKTLGA